MKKMIILLAVMTAATLLSATTFPISDAFPSTGPELTWSVQGDETFTTVGDISTSVSAEVDLSFDVPVEFQNPSYTGDNTCASLECNMDGVARDWVAISIGDPTDKNYGLKVDVAYDINGASGTTEFIGIGMHYQAGDYTTNSQGYTELASTSYGFGFWGDDATTPDVRFYKNNVSGASSVRPLSSTGTGAGDGLIGNWHTMEMRYFETGASEARIRTFYKGDLLHDYTDTTPIETGTMFFSLFDSYATSIGDIQGLFDNFEAYATTTPVNDWNLF